MYGPTSVVSTQITTETLKVCRIWDDQYPFASEKYAVLVLCDVHSFRAIYSVGIINSQVFRVVWTLR